jgi:hypothetical protein
MKKIYNQIKDTIKSPNTMVSEEEEEFAEAEEAPPSLEVTIARMIS